MNDTISNLHIYVYYVLYCVGDHTPSNSNKIKQPRYELTQVQRDLIKSDSVNAKIWQELMEYAESTGSVS